VGRGRAPGPGATFFARSCFSATYGRVEADHGAAGRRFEATVDEASRPILGKRGCGRAPRGTVAVARSPRALQSVHNLLKCRIPLKKLHSGGPVGMRPGRGPASRVVAARRAGTGELRAGSREVRRCPGRRRGSGGAGRGLATVGLGAVPGGSRCNSGTYVRVASHAATPAPPAKARREPQSWENANPAWRSGPEAKRGQPRPVHNRRRCKSSSRRLRRGCPRAASGPMPTGATGRCRPAPRAGAFKPRARHAW
jgi:hypothetical protein